MGSAQPLEHTLDALMADLDAVGLLDLHRDASETGAGVPHFSNIGKSAPFRLVLDQHAIFAHPPSEWTVTAEVLPTPPLVALGVTDALADPLPLEFGNRAKDRQDQPEMPSPETSPPRSNSHNEIRRR
jgi:hypothetical protein